MTGAGKKWRERLAAAVDWRRRHARRRLRQVADTLSFYARARMRPQPFADGLKVWCHNDAMGRMILSRQPFEANETDLIRTLARDCGVFYDIGANQGYYSLIVARASQGNCRIYAFEPSRRERRRFRRNLRLNAIDGVGLYPLALGAAHGVTAELFVVDGLETGCNSLRPPAEDAGERLRRERVSIASLDRFVETATRAMPELIKMDVEGGELDVLKGAAGILNGGNRPVWMLEAADLRTLPWGYRADAIVEYLAERRYACFSIGERLLTPVLAGRARSDNLLAVPAESLSDLKSRIQAAGWHTIE